MFQTVHIRNNYACYLWLQTGNETEIILLSVYTNSRYLGALQVSNFVDVLQTGIYNCQHDQKLIRMSYQR